jgi:hypothetical protein
VWPVNLDVISWLGAFHVRNEVRVLLRWRLAGWKGGGNAGWLAILNSCKTASTTTGGGGGSV